MSCRDHPVGTWEERVEWARAGCCACAAMVCEHAESVVVSRITATHAADVAREVWEKEGLDRWEWYVLDALVHRAHTIQREVRSIRTFAG